MGAVLARCIFPTNAHKVSRLRSLYSNEQLYKDVHQEPDLLEFPHPLNGYERALEFMKKNSFRRANYQPFGVFSGLPNREQCGIGLYLHMFSLLYFGVFFIICSLIAIGPLVLDYQNGYGDKYEDQAKYFPTLGNTLTFPDTCSMEKAQDVYEELQFFQLLQVTFDAFYTFLFLVAILVYIVWTRRLIEIHRSRHPTLADYSIKITQLPEHRIPELAYLMETMGLIVHEIVPVRHVNNLLRHFQAFELRRSSLVLQVLSNHTERYNFEKYNVEVVLGCMFSSEQGEKRLIEESHSAIVVFESRQDRAKALKRFRKFWVTAWVQKVNTYIRKRFGWERNWEAELNAKWMSTPSEVCWENIRKKRYGIRILYYCATVIVILASATAIFALRSQQNDIDDNNSQDDNESQADFDRRIQSGSMKFLISMCIACVNSVLPWVLNRILTYNERQSTIPRQKLSAMMKIFFSVLINTSFVIVIVNANFQDFKVHVVLRMIDSRFKDYSRDWYLEVGFSIMLSMLICALSPHALWCVYYVVKVKCLKAVQRLFDTQLAYNHWAIGADIDLPLTVAMELVIIFTCFIYSGGMPLMLPICAISLFSLYICTIYMLRFVRKPSEHSTILNTWFVNLLPWSIIIHCLFSAYMFGAESIFPSQSPMDWQSKGLNSTNSFIYEEYFSYVNNSYDKRATNFCGKTFICLAGAAFFVGLINPFLQKKIGQKMGLDSRSLSQVLSLGNVQGGKSYFIFRNTNYEQFYTGVFQHEASVDEKGQDLQVESPHPEDFPTFFQ